MRTLILVGWLCFAAASVNAQIPSLKELIRKQTFVDRLHGFSVQLPTFWRAKVFGNSVIIKDEGLHFILIRGARYDGNLKLLAQKWLQERTAMNRLASRFSGKQPKFAFHKTQNGIVIYGEGLGYPYTLDPETSINFSEYGAYGVQLPSEYREVTAILPGEKMALLVTLLFPAESEETARKQMLEIVKSFRFLPPEQMVRWRPEEVRCFETGLTAATMHVPEGFEFRASTIAQGKKRRVIYFLRSGEKMLRKDFIDLNTHVIQGQFGTSGGSILIINGQASQQPQPIMVTSKEECLQLLLAIWRAETGKDWRVRESSELPTPPLTKAFKERLSQQLPPLPVAGQQQEVNFVFIAESDGLVRVGAVSGSFLISADPSAFVSTQSCFLNMEVTVTQLPANESGQTIGIFNGFLASLVYNPEWVMRTMEIWAREHSEENRLVLQMLKEGQEFNTRMATAWTNLLSDHTYAKDPETGEIFKLQKRSWETGDFWREPIFGDVILGGVERESKLEELLRMEGWRRLTESLEGFPEMWK